MSPSINLFSSIYLCLLYPLTSKFFLQAGRSDSLRARAILRSLVSMDDLEGVLGLRFILPISKVETVMTEEGEVEQLAAAGRWKALWEGKYSCNVVDKVVDTLVDGWCSFKGKCLDILNCHE